MGFLIGLLSFIMVLDCVVLVLLVLIQLPKKEAGAGLAFGGSATDALFGAGSGNVLTKITKYAAGIFFGMALVLSVMQSNYHNRSAAELERKLGKTPLPGGAIAPRPAPAPAPMSVPAPVVNTVNTNLLRT